VTTRWQAIAALVDQSRRALYEYVRARHRPVSRDAAASAVGISHNLAAFHLDKLVEAGLLTADYQNPPDRARGPGRVPKVYQPSDLQLTLSIPERRYDLLGEIVVEAIAHHPNDAQQAALRIAADRGAAIGRAAHATPDDSTTVGEILAELGFEPDRHEATTLLRNCPFHRLAQREPALVCGINRAFLQGLLDGLGETDVRAVLAPQPPACCVELHQQRPRQ
jgi:predicted ArsR family transcriptional regulator